MTKPIARESLGPPQDDGDEPEVMIDEREAARRVGLSPHTLRKYRVSGDGPKFARLGRRVLYREAWLFEWIESKAVRSTSER